MAYPAKVITFLISDVVGNDISTISSGPTYLYKKDFNKALEVLTNYKIKAPVSILKYLKKMVNEKKIKYTFNVNNSISVIANPQIALEAAAKKAREYGYYPIILSDSMSGESRDLAKFQASIIKQFSFNKQITKKPILFLSGGETTVNLVNNTQKYGKGGRNSEFILSLALELEKTKNFHAIACDTDGIDGSEFNAGAYINSNTLLRAKKRKLSPEQYLKKHNSFEFFYKLSDLVVTGPTFTNVNDFRAILIY